MNASSRQGAATLAVLIDADNAAPGIVEGLLAEVAKYGVAAVKRIYGDWTKPNLSGWKECLLAHSIQPIQQFRYTVGKNATDSAMIIDAMDLLYTGRFDGFCIVSSDSDFTRLASRIREQGLTVYGFGERKTPKPFVTACDKFIYSDVLRAETEADEAATPTRKRSTGELRQDSRLVRLLQSAAKAVSDEEGWTTLGSMGNHIAKQAPEFDSRNYGYGKLSELVTATNLFEVETRNGNNNKTLWVRLKKRGKQGEQERQVEVRAGEAKREAGPKGGAEFQPQGKRRPDPAPQPRAHDTAPLFADPVPQAESFSVAYPDLAEPSASPLEALPEAMPAAFTDADDAAVEDRAAETAGQGGNERRGDRNDRKRRKAGKPEVKLSETPWPIDRSVFTAPAAPWDPFSLQETAAAPADEPANAPMVESAAAPVGGPAADIEPSATHGRAPLVVEGGPIRKRAPRKAARKPAAEPHAAAGELAGMPADGLLGAASEDTQPATENSGVTTDDAAAAKPARRPARARRTSAASKAARAAKATQQQE